MNEVMKELYLITKTEKRLTSAYHPQVFVFVILEVKITYGVDKVYMHGKERKNVHDKITVTPYRTHLTV